MEGRKGRKEGSGVRAKQCLSYVYSVFLKAIVIFEFREPGTTAATE